MGKINIKTQLRRVKFMGQEQEGFSLEPEKS